MVPIELLREGDLVATIDEHAAGAQVVFKPITRVWENPGYEIMVLSLTNGSELRVTSAHEVYRVGFGWGLAEDARVGDWMLDDHALPVMIESINREYRAGLVYNLEVEGTHTFFANGVWVHNCGEFEFHHFLPKQFWSWFEKGKKFTKQELDALGESIFRDWHKRIHGKETGRVTSWNGRWKKFIEENPGATREEVLDFLLELKTEFGFNF